MFPTISLNLPTWPKTFKGTQDSGRRRAGKSEGPLGSCKCRRRFVCVRNGVSPPPWRLSLVVVHACFGIRSKIRVKWSENLLPTTKHSLAACVCGLWNKHTPAHSPLPAHHPQNAFVGSHKRQKKAKETKCQISFYFYASLPLAPSRSGTRSLPVAHAAYVRSGLPFICLHIWRLILLAGDSFFFSDTLYRESFQNM